MKKSLLTALALPLVCAIFFSCQSTNGSAKNAADAESLAAEQSAQSQESGAADEAAASGTAQSPDSTQAETAADGANAAAADNAGSANSTANLADAANSAQEEKISQSEMDEFSELLNNDKNESSASQESAKNQESAGGIEQSQDGSLAQKIKDAAKNDAAASSAAQDTRVSLAPSSSKDSDNNGGKTTDGGADLSRLTNQGKEITGGPLIGPSSDKVPGGQSAGGQANGGAKTASNNPSTPKNAAQNKAAAGASSNSGRSDNSAAETNEAIALDGVQVAQEQVEEEKPEPVPSRSMTIKNNQFLDVVYPGSGWIYLGEEGAGDHFIFQGRKLGKGDTTFTLRSKEPGVALLHFYKNDILTGNYIDDYIQISITDKSATDASHVEAPSYAEVVPPKFDRTKAVQEKKAAQADQSAPSAPQKEAAPQSDGGQKKTAAKDAQPDKKEAAQESPSEKVQTVIQTAGQEKGDSKQKTAVAGTTAPAAQEETKESALDQSASGGTNTAKSLLERAQKAYDEKRYAEALDLVQQFFDTASEDFDAGLYLEGLILEAKSEVRNIKSAIGAYDTLIKNWPQSNYWRKANERSIYLKRFYIDIR